MAKIEAKLNEKSININKLIELKNTIILEINIPEELENTLYGEDSLRKEYNSYFYITKADIGSRKREPYILKIILTSNGKEYTEEVKIDVLDTFLSNMNSEAHVTNSELVNAKTPITVWMD